MHNSAPRILVIIPAFNEAATVGAVVRQIVEHLPDADILVVDDGSTDNTAACVPPPARLVQLPFNLGIGGAMQTGYRFADAQGYDVAIQVDADGQHPPHHLRQLVDKLKEADADMIIGSRFLEPGAYRQTPTRMAGIIILRTVIKLLTGKRITDCTSGFRAVNRRVIERFASFYPDDYPEPEVVMLLLRAGLRVEETPVSMRQRQAGRSSIPLSIGLFYTIKVTAALLLGTVREPWPK